jgi:DNA-binding NarL/FixJ family response regulator
VILLDIGLRNEDGLQAGRRILDRWPGMRIIALSALDDERAVDEAIQIGFHAFVMTETPRDDLVRIIRAIARGEPVPLPLSKRLGLTARLYKLTPLERDVLGLLVEGPDERTIATQLDLTKGEVRSLVQNILEKLHVHSRLAAAVKAISEVPNPSTDHPHLTPMTDDQILAHLRYMHARGIAPFSPADSDNLRELHEKLHRQPPP